MTANYRSRKIVADSVVHIIGCLSSVAAAIVLLARVLPRADMTVTAAALVYAAGLIAMLWASAAYNLAPNRDWKARLRRCDHAAIFLMIAGTYTPFALIGLGGPAGWQLLAVVWAVAIAGIALKLCFPGRFERLAIALYLALGWAGLPLGRELLIALPGDVFVLLVAGGAIYTAGVAFYLWERWPCHNAVWHCCVLAAAACHYGAVLELMERAAAQTAAALPLAL